MRMSIERPKVVITIIFKQINFDIFGDILTLRFAAKRRVRMSTKMSKLIFVLKMIVITTLGLSTYIL